MSTTDKLSSNSILLEIIGAIIALSFLWFLFLLTTPLNAFLIVFGLFSIILIFIKPLDGLLFLILLRPTLDIFTSRSIITLDEYSLNIASILAVLAIILSGFIILKNPSELKSVPLKFPLISFVLIAFISIFYSVDSSISIAEWIRILSIFSLYLLSFILIKNQADFKRLIYTIILSIFIPGITAFYQFFTKTGMTIIDEDISNRIFGTFAHPNLFAYYLTIPIVLIIFLSLNKEKSQIKNIFLYASFAFSFVLLALTYTRGAWVVFLITIFILGIAKYRKFLAGALLGLILVYLLIPPLNTRVNNLFTYNPFSSIQWRINLWKDSIKYSQEKIIAGHGLGTANKIILDRRGEKLGSPDPHNDYLKILIENGILGFFFYSLIIVSLFIALFKGFIRSTSAFDKNLFLLFIGISLALYFMSFADNVIRNTALQWIFWILLGALFAHQKNSKN